MHVRKCLTCGETDGPKLTYKPMNVCPSCKERAMAVADIHKDKNCYTLVCSNCGIQHRMPREFVQMAIFKEGTLVGYHDWIMNEDIFPPMGTNIDWEGLYNL